MPCYCDIPDIGDQAEIERRCKERMYFDAQDVLTSLQLFECKMHDLKRFPMSDLNDQLCKICKILTKEQMEKITAHHFEIAWNHKTLYDWHMQHCKDDIEHNKDSE